MTNIPRRLKNLKSSENIIILDKLDQLKKLMITKIKPSINIMKTKQLLELPLRLQQKPSVFRFIKPEFETIGDFNE
jgi:hypothetical protein